MTTTLAAAQRHRIDLDTAHAARREAIGDAIEVTFLGDVYLLPVELPLDVMEPLAELLGAAGAVTPGEPDKPDAGGGMSLEDPATLRLLEHGKDAIHLALARLFGAEQWARFRAGKPDHPGRPSLADMWVLLNGMLGAYGVTLGEVLGPIASLLSGGPPWNPTLPATTSSTPDGSGAATPPS